MNESGILGATSVARLQRRGAELAPPPGGEVMNALEYVVEQESVGILAPPVLPRRPNGAPGGEEPDPTTVVVPDLFGGRGSGGLRCGASARTGWRGKGVEVGVVDAAAGPPGTVGGDHATAMLKVIVGGHGEPGISEEARRAVIFRCRRVSRARGIQRFDVFQRLLTAILELRPPAVLVVAFDGVHADGETYSPRLCLEAWPLARALFLLADALGVVPVVAAGNGQGADLDRFGGGLFWPSPALVVAAGRADRPQRCRASNRGCRVDLHAWGEGVGIPGTDGERSWFGGTSCATAIVAGAVAVVLSRLFAPSQGSASGAGTARLVRDLLVSTGYWAVDGLGPRPDLDALRTAFEAGTTASRWPAYPEPCARGTIRS